MALRFLCPNCASEVTADEGVQSARCTACLRWLHAVTCAHCEHAFIALADGSSRCPRCGTETFDIHAELSTFEAARDPATMVINVAVPRPMPGPAPALRDTRLDGRRAAVAGWVRTGRSVPRVLVTIFTVLTWLAVLSGAAGVLVAIVVGTHHHLGARAVAWWTASIVVSTVVAGSLLAFCAATLRLLLELVERPGEQ